MATPYIRKMPSFNAVAAGQTATLSLPTQGTYHRIKLYYTSSGTPANQATIEAAITEIRVLIDGRIQRRYSAAELIVLNSIRGRDFTAGYLTLFLSEPGRKTIVGEDALGWGMATVSTFQIEVDIASGATAPALAAWAMWSPEVRELGRIVKVRQFGVPVAASGDQYITTLPREEAYLGIHMGSRDITDIEITVDSVKVWDANLSVLSDFLSDQDEFREHSAWASILFDIRDQRLADALPMLRSDGTRVSDFELKVTAGTVLSVAGNLEIVTEVLGRRN